MWYMAGPWIRRSKKSDMKRLFILLVAGLLSLAVSAQEASSSRSRMFLPVDAGISLAARDAIGPAFYMRACLEYRMDVNKGLFITGELDTRTHPHTDGGIVLGNAAAGDAAFTDILLGPGWRFMFSERFKFALSLQGGASTVMLKEVAPAEGSGRYNLTGRSKWYGAAKAGTMLEFYINPLFDLFLAAGLPVTFVPVETMSADPAVIFPTLSIGFSMAL